MTIPPFDVFIKSYGPTLPWTITQQALSHRLKVTGGDVLDDLTAPYAMNYMVSVELLAAYHDWLMKQLESESESETPHFKDGSELSEIVRVEFETVVTD